MEKVKITRVYVTDKDKQGNPLIGQARDGKPGRPYTRMSIQCTQYGEKWLSGFKGKENENWKEGDEVEVIVKKAGDQGQYLNFEVPKKDDKAIEMMSEILTKIGTINAKMDVIYGIIRPKNEPGVGGSDYPTEDINPDDIPF